MKAEDRLALHAFPEDWRYYTLTFPVARCKHMTAAAVIREMNDCTMRFYSLPWILGRPLKNVRHRRAPVATLVGNLSCRGNIAVDLKAYARFQSEHGRAACAGEGMSGNR